MKIKIRCIIRKKNYIYDISYTKIKKREKKQFTQKYEENIKKLKFRFRIILPDITRVTRAVYFFDYIRWCAYTATQHWLFVHYQ